MESGDTTKNTIFKSGATNLTCEIPAFTLKRTKIYNTSYLSKHYSIWQIIGLNLFPEDISLRYLL